LVAHEDALNRLNVFPVPDGDTGTNMGHTLKAVVRAISDSNLGNDLSDIASTVANSALLGARGNSGVILSQIFHGFAEGIGDRKRANAMDIAYSLKRACEKAYAAVSSPTEGTILTVVREGVDAAYEKARTEVDIAVVIETLLTACKRSLANTPNLLPALKAANVVDAGAMGFVFIIEGIQRLLTGAELPETELEAGKPDHSDPPGPASIDLRSQYGYCTELLIRGSRLAEAEIRNALQNLGDSLIVAGGANGVKIHVHTARPGAILECCQHFGILHDVKIENMDAQHAALSAGEPEKQIAIIAVAMGEGLRRIFESMGCDFVIQGGQTMNPSVQELSDAIRVTANRYRCRQLILLPNNGNVLFSAEQACALHAQREVVVIPTRTVPEGFSALMAFDPEADLPVNVERMRQAIKQVKTGEVTQAVKEYQSDDLQVRAGDTIAIHQNKILGTFPDAQSAVRHMVATLLGESDAVISLFHGEDTPEVVAQALAQELALTYPDLDVELHHGGQPHYAYIVSIE